jgi:hypothetical protein
MINSSFVNYDSGGNANLFYINGDETLLSNFYLEDCSFYNI